MKSTTYELASTLQRVPRNMKTTQAKKNKKKKPNTKTTECVTCGYQHNPKLTCLQAWLASSSPNWKPPSKKELAEAQDSSG